MPAGTLSIADLQANRFQSAAEFGLSTINEVLQADLEAYNRVMLEMTTDMAETSADRQRIYGTSADGEMLESDEYDRGTSMKVATGATAGFPLFKYLKNINWTRDYFLMSTPADIAETVLAIQSAHLRAHRRSLQRAVFNPANRTVREQFVTPLIDLGVKAFVNADGAPIPNGPNGETFNAATHTHYDFIDSAAPTAAGLTALIEDVIEHGHGSMLKLNINRAAETAVRALTGFVPYVDPRLTLGTQANQPGERVDITRIDNRAIGLFGAAEVWVRSWVPAGYVLCYDAGTPMKPLVQRTHPVAGLVGLRVAATLDDYPLYAQTMESYFGYGVWTRTNGAVLYYAAGAVAYVTPTFS